MKKSILLLTFITIFSVLYSQSKDEYRYIGIKLFTTSNLSFPPPANDNFLIRTESGDMAKKNNEIFTYTPGGGGSIIYNYDFKRDLAGIAIGIDIQNYGFSNHYITLDENYKLSNQYRVLQIGVPFLVKFGFTNIYEKQSYFTAGAQFNQYFMHTNIQKTSWKETSTVISMPKEQRKNSAISLMLGYNYGIYFVNFQLLSTNYISKKYQTTTFEGSVTPYSHLNILNNLYIQLGINIPLTRWLTARNWQAEQIRRSFKRNQ